MYYFVAVIPCMSKFLTPFNFHNNFSFGIITGIEVHSGSIGAFKF